MSIDVGIKKRFRDFYLDVSFSTKGKRIGILGASGSGKSLTLKALAGLMLPDEGSICADDSILFDAKRRINVKPGKRNIGYLFQDYALFPNMTVEGNIKAALHGTERTGKDGRNLKTFGNGSKAGILEEIIKRFNLTEIRDHLPDELSGGQKQRTALARMLATDPDLILLDEPFTAMDSHLKEGLRLELIRILDMYDKTVILVSHDRDEIYQMCEYLILLDDGRVIAQGNTDELFEDPGSVAAAKLTGCKNISRIERLSDHRVKALDWEGIELTTGGRVTDEVTHIGIRAHDLTAAYNGENVIPCRGVKVSRLPFEWYMVLENGLWWKLKRELYDSFDKDMLPENISVDPDRILLLMRER